MKKLNILVALLSVLLVSSAANAGEIGVSGSVKASMSVGSSESTAGVVESGDGKTLAVSNDINFDAAGELDNGWTWKWQTQLDAGAIDDTRLEISTPMVTLGLYGTEGGLNFKHGGSQMALGYGSQIGNSGGLVDPDDIGTYNNVQLHTAADLLPFKTVIKAGMTMSGSATSEAGDSPVNTTTGTTEGGLSYQVEAEPVDGLSVGASYFEIEQTDSRKDLGQKEEHGAYYASYEYGQFGIGYSRAMRAPSSDLERSTTQLYNYYETDSISIGYTVNDDLSISYGQEESHRNLRADASEYDLEIMTIQAAYTMGGMTVTAGIKDIENADYTQNKDISEGHLVVSMAF